jgi:hypothetical protein
MDPPWIQLSSKDHTRRVLSAQCVRVFGHYALKTGCNNNIQSKLKLMNLNRSMLDSGFRAGDRSRHEISDGLHFARANPYVENDVLPERATFIFQYIQSTVVSGLNTSFSVMPLPPSRIGFANLFFNPFRGGVATVLFLC